MSIISITLNPGLITIVQNVVAMALGVLAPVFGIASSTLTTILGLISLNVL